MANDRSVTPKRPTLADVAAHAGVSRALVSIVIRGANGASDATRKRVLAAADELGYRPDVRARLLARSQSKLIGVVFGMAGTFHFDVLDGLYAAAEKRGYELILSALTASRDERRAVDSLNDFRFDALIMLGPPTSRPTLAGEVPLVVVGWHVDHPAVDVVRTSDSIGMALAVGHLVAAGRRDIVHIDGGPGSVADARREGYRAAMIANGLGAQIRILPGGITQLDGYDAVRSLLDGESMPSAVVAFNDEVAVTVLEACRQAGVTVPGDVAVIGWDDSAISRLPHIDLTTVGQDAAVMAELALNRAIDRVEGARIDARDIVLEPVLHVRGTTVH
jgi:DNA-binding LacI/PurR family transcriptional regulator